MNKKNEYREKFIEVLRKLDSGQIAQLTNSIWDTYKRGGTIFFAGNGGSAATASHMSADIGKNTTINYNNGTEKRFKTVSLTDNMAWVTAVGNDISFDDIFLEQFKNFCTKNDLLFIISGSGNSMNIVKLVLWAKREKIKTVGLLGFDGGIVGEFIDIPLVVNSKDYGLVESAHSFIHHAIVELLKEKKKLENK